MRFASYEIKWRFNSAHSTNVILIWYFVFGKSSSSVKLSGRSRTICILWWLYYRVHLASKFVKIVSENNGNVLNDLIHWFSVAYILISAIVASLWWWTTNFFSATVIVRALCVSDSFQHTSRFFLFSIFLHERRIIVDFSRYTSYWVQSRHVSFESRAGNIDPYVFIY